MQSDSYHTHIPVTMLRSALKQPSRPSSPALATPSSPSPRPGAPPRTTSSSSLVTSPSIVQSQFGLGTSVSMLSPNPQSATSALVVSQGYTPKVSFDTFENPAASMFSFTLHVQSDGYTRNSSTRVFLCASSPDESGREALEWALECLVQDGDELIVFRGIDQEELEKDHELVREEARDLMRHIQDKCVEYDPDRKVSLLPSHWWLPFELLLKISIILEFIAGRVTTTLDRLIALYRPDSVVVGMRDQRRGVLGFGGGRSGGVFSGKSYFIPWWSVVTTILFLAGVGSVSKYALSHSPVPIIVVRPERNVRKIREKRLKDPKRGTHFNE
ncbi:hypothetical protein J3R83DRAFT_13999 [Lanmaoa asiatica]|nr:hypothetical protein J3R83DRAFT_13999 [Lanmaoa asiatica]